MLLGGSDAGKLSFNPFFSSSTDFLSAAERSFGVSACLSVGAGSNLSAMALFSVVGKNGDTPGLSLLNQLPLFDGGASAARVMRR
ncbi:hypothetical protein BjapCC829_46780 (plasmid) [Bradyrhizobium barranii]|uniref:Uncharacterized protein n=1 Tax=Bradyrhizobium barranii TaxID=2992140 RepID=A0ABY3R0N4_9BRAD|nr:hypothetical protein [Bradyrhizobium japonicum]UFW91520.1 hypothetical protein BjapCC829_46780 [Bradyrhizobium japonicum]